MPKSLTGIRFPGLMYLSPQRLSSVETWTEQISVGALGQILLTFLRLYLNRVKHCVPLKPFNWLLLPKAWLNFRELFYLKKTWTRNSQVLLRWSSSSLGSGCRQVSDDISWLIFSVRRMESVGKAQRHSLSPFSLRTGGVKETQRCLLTFHPCEMQGLFIRDRWESGVFIDLDNNSWKLWPH